MVGGKRLELLLPESKSGVQPLHQPPIKNGEWGGSCTPIVYPKGTVLQTVATPLSLPPTHMVLMAELESATPNN